MMVRTIRIWAILVLLGSVFFTGKSNWAAESDEFVVVVCNVENLFDADGISLFDDYKPESYRPSHLLTKLRNHAEVLAQVNNGAGPDIILFQELEADQTPGIVPFDFAAFTSKFADAKLDSMLSETMTEEAKDLPAAAFLLKALQERGLGKYHVAVAEYRPDPTGRVVAHVNATFSRFPIRQVTTYHTPGARGILEVIHELDGSLLYTLNNHWKSGASDPESERIREGNARELRKRLDDVLALDGHADIIIGGDFNSQFNQSEAYPEMQTTAIQSVLGSQGDEKRIQTEGGLLYNFWYELEAAERASDVFQDRWGTLMQMMVTRGAYDHHGIQYVDNSFQPVVIEGVNGQVGTRLPIRWNPFGESGGGYSDHFPIAARFRILGATENREYLELTDSVRSGPESAAIRKVDYSAVKTVQVPSLNRFANDSQICNPRNLGHVFIVEGEISGERPLRIRIHNDEYNIWAFDVELRKQIYARMKVGEKVRFYGEVSIHEDQWQFVVRDLSWLDE